MGKRLTGPTGTGRRNRRAMVVMMSSVALPEPFSPREPLRRVALKATRPALNDLRFRGDAEVHPAADGADVCLGTYRLTRVECTELDVASLARAFSDLRTGQARRNLARR